MEYNFVHTSVSPVEMDSVLQGFPRNHPLVRDNPSAYPTVLAVDYTYHYFNDREIMAHLMARAGIFKSVGEARRNGWDKPIPPGYTDMFVTKKKIRLTIVNKV